MRKVLSNSFITGIGLIAALIVAWFLLVDASGFVEKCPKCGYGRFVKQYRILRRPVKERSSKHHTLLEKVASDLGIACHHSEMSRVMIQRWQGLCVSAGETKAGTFFIGSDDSWYDEHVSATLKKMAMSNPGLIEQFRKRALIDHDSEYLREFWTRLKKESQSDGFQQSTD